MLGNDSWERKVYALARIAMSKVKGNSIQFFQFNSLLLMCRVNSKTPITETAQCKY
jgi:hypothetical protein